MDRQECAAFIRKDIKYDDRSDIMNGKRISFNQAGETEYFFISSAFRPWFDLAFLTVHTQIKRIHVMTMEAM